MTARIICDDCGGSGRDTAGHNFAYTGGNYACENCSGQGGWEPEEGDTGITLAELRAKHGSQLTELPSELKRTGTGGWL